MIPRGFLNHPRRGWLWMAMLLAVAGAQAQSSALVYLENGQLAYQPFAATGQADSVHVIPDFSYAGYHGGGVALPEVPVVKTLAPSGGDDRLLIQQAIDSVAALPLGANGFRGAILLTAGHYQVSDSLRIAASGVVLRGEGQGRDGTVLHANRASSHDFIHVTGAGTSLTLHSGSMQPIVSPYVPLGSYRLVIADAAGYSVGDTIAVQRTPNQAWIDTLGMDEATLCAGDPGCTGWTPSAYVINHERIITAIAGDTLTLNIPIVDVMETPFGGGRVYKASVPGRIEHCGIERLRIESAYASDTDEDHGRSAIVFGRVAHSWVQQVTTRYFWMGAVLLNRESTFNTIQEVACLDPKSLITGGRRYSFTVKDGVGNLFQRCYTREGRHDFEVASRVTGPNVFLDSYCTQTHADIGPHQRWATGTLFDNIRGGQIRVRNRGNSGSGHGWVGSATMFWNLVSFTQDIRVESPLGGMNWGIGCVGLTRNGDGYWESWNVPVQPRSLYLQQLADRLGPQAVANVTLPAQRAGDLYDILAAWAGEGDLSDQIVPAGTLPALEDATIRGGSHSDTAYPDEPQLEVKDDAGGDEDTRQTYIKFDLRGLPGPQKRATLRLFVSHAHPTMHRVRAVASDNWADSTLTWNNAPPAGDTLDTQPVPALGTWAEFDLTGYFNQEMQGDSLLSLRIEEVASQGLVQYSASETGRMPHIRFVDDSVNIPPRAAFTYTAQAYHVAFDAGESRDLDGSLVAYAWDFGDGNSGSGQAVTHVYATQGDYLITLTVTDSDSNTAVAQQLVSVLPFATLSPQADSYLRGGAYGATNYGLASVMEVRENDGTLDNTRRAILKFDLSRIQGGADTVLLRLKVTDNRNGPGASHRVRAIADTTWQETAVTWNNAPVVGATVATQLLPPTGEWVTFDLTHHVNQVLSGGGSWLSLSIEDVAFGNLVKYASRETSEAPQLYYEIGLASTSLNSPVAEGACRVFPNPVMGDQVTFALDLPRPGAVSLVLFDRQGKRLLQEQALLGSGPQILRIPTRAWAGAPRGIYFYRLIGEDFSHSGKLVLP